MFDFLGEFLIQLLIDFLAWLVSDRRR